MRQSTSRKGNHYRMGSNVEDVRGYYLLIAMAAGFGFIWLLERRRKKSKFAELFSLILALFFMTLPIISFIHILTEPSKLIINRDSLWSENQLGVVTSNSLSWKNTKGVFISGDTSVCGWIISLIIRDHENRTICVGTLSTPETIQSAHYQLVNFFETQGIQVNTNSSP
jgi:hypothetical protein